VTCVDTRERKILWGFDTQSEIVVAAPAISGERVFFGTTSGNDATFYCVDAATGEEIWRLFEPGGGFSRSAVVEDDVVFCYTVNTLYALRAPDGDVVWTHQGTWPFYSSPTLDGEGRLFITTNPDERKPWALRTADGSVLWSFQMSGYAAGAITVEDGRVYAGTLSGPREVYCLDAKSGKLIWRSDVPNSGVWGVTLGQPEYGRAYSITDAGQYLFALEKEAGDEIWRFAIPESLTGPAIVDGSETIYFGTTRGDVNVYAVNPDGTELWSYAMPRGTFGSPILGPDGTLYVVSKDKYVYAFKDPAKCPADIDGSGNVDFADVLSILSAWGPYNPCPPFVPEDVDDDCEVGFTDLLIVLSAWGPCR
jgi:outer membrane protein assembly factor BamB